MSILEVIKLVLKRATEGCVEILFLEIATSLPATPRSRLRLMLAMTLKLAYFYN
jgi:hypothetical protein